MTAGSDSAAWCAVDLTPGRARAWHLLGETVTGTRQIEMPDEGPGGQSAVDLLRRLCDGMPAMVCGPGLGAAAVAVPAKPGMIVPVPLADGLVHALPGLRQDSPPALMDADAARIAGFLALNPRWDGVICLPGQVTHWAQISADEVVSFQSFLTGETATALAAAPSLRAAGAGEGWDNAAFGAALETAMSRPERLAAGLAAIAAEAVLDRLGPGQARARLYGLLTGAELTAARPYWLGQQVALIGPDAAARPYAEALQRQGVPTTLADEARMTLAGLVAARRRIAGAG
ncbi:2-dehydro-3-deoxygalactonokinase [Antarcticimicrobium luteum]|uniref:2-keto-3-deoxy-galactonokinase n=1 Tax=Antarcticimicrobium luteum TaxID=2547397 RepID=A0A4R5USP3_9RHOB|nr:2-dehydro-3-deoxygalactonokinase [Antarcticimicrobium luteum]TDK42139.1 2-keto-3-deoxy-galactonokinase [Antarcticimicrobium luteum]